MAPLCDTSNCCSYFASMKEEAQDQSQHVEEDILGYYREIDPEPLH